MSAVLHGRRKGQERSTPELPRGMKGQQARSAMALPNGTDLRQVTVLSKGDWNRIQMSLNKRALEQERIKKDRAERERLHKMSMEKVKNWSNTIAGQRQKKLEYRKIREDKEEEERKLVDVEEAKFQQHKRREAIERAKTQQYYQTDRVKGFHGALLLTEVLKEREAQLELKRLKELASAGKDNHWLQQEQHEYEEGILKDQDEARERIRQTRENADFQKAQIRNHLKEHDRVRDEQAVEGEELKRLAARHELEKKRLDEIRSAEAKQLLNDNIKQIGDVHRMKEISKQQEEEEDEECRIFAAAKRKMMKLRAEKEKQLHEEKQSKLQSIREKLHSQMLQKLDDEDDRIHRATEEAEAKRAKEEAMKEAKNRKALSAIALHRHEQMSEMELDAAEQRKQDKEMQLARMEADRQFRSNEEEKTRRRFDESRNLQQFHEGQINERQDGVVRSREEQLAMDKRNQELVEIEETQFQEYAKKVIDHCERGGRNTHPLRRAAKDGAGGGLGPTFPGKGGVRPSYMVNDLSGVQMPHYQRDTTDDTKTNIYGDGKTNKRLGFVW